MSTAYLLAVFRIDGDTLVFLGTDVFSESSPTIGGGYVTFIVDEADGSTYSEAKERLLDNVASRSWQQWALRSLVKR